jgi:hypothetical protein
MPLHPATDNAGCFDPDAIKSLTAAYEHACAELHVPVERSSLNEIVAKKIIAHALDGERDPILLRDVVVAELRREAIFGFSAAVSLQLAT